MTAAMVSQHDAWTANGGDLLMYYVVAWDYQWGFTDNMSNLDTPKNRAIDALNQRAPAAVTYGTLVPAVLNAGRWSINSGSSQVGDNPINLRPFAVGAGVDPAATYWTAYTIRSDRAATYQLSVTYSANQAGELKTLVDGTPLDLLPIQNTNGSDRRTATLNVPLGAGIHSIRLQSTRGDFSVRSIQVEAGVLATPVPTLTPTPAPVEVEAPPPVDQVSEQSPDGVPSEDDLVSDQIP
jgi:hypothetical protein